MGDKIIRLFYIYMLFGFDAFDTSKWNKTYHGISQGTLFSINHHVASNVDCNSYKCTFVVHIGKKQMNVKVTIVLVSYPLALSSETKLISTGHISVNECLSINAKVQTNPLGMCLWAELTI